MKKSNVGNGQSFDSNGSETKTVSRRGRKPGKKSIQQNIQRQDSDEAQKSLKGVFEDLLKDTYNAEKQLIKALPKISDAASSRELKEVFDRHIEETERQAKRLEKIFSMVRFNLDSQKCKAMEGLIEEAQKILDEFDEGSVRDAALIIATQKIEHYEIAAYGSLRALADIIGYHRAADMLDQSLEEESLTDDILNEIAEYINEDALYAVEVGEY